MAEPIRLQKFIAHAGIASRRKAEVLIREGRVKVNGEVVTELGTRISARNDAVEVDGVRISTPDAWTYILLNKPAGTVTTASDEFGRRTVMEIVQIPGTRLYPVGRLDFDSEGVLILTNDGELAAGLTHPAGEVQKIYRVKLTGHVTEKDHERLLLGVQLEDGLARAVRVVESDMGPRASKANSWLDITVTEGRNHLVKRMCEAIGHPVIRLRRIVLANLNLDGLRVGEHREIEGAELSNLRAIAVKARNRQRHGKPEQAQKARKTRPRK